MYLSSLKNETKNLKIFLPPNRDTCQSPDPNSPMTPTFPENGGFQRGNNSKLCPPTPFKMPGRYVPKNKSPLFYRNSRSNDGSNQPPTPIKSLGMSRLGSSKKKNMENDEGGSNIIGPYSSDIFDSYLSPPNNNPGNNINSRNVRKRAFSLGGRRKKKVQNSHQNINKSVGSVPGFPQMNSQRNGFNNPQPTPMKINQRFRNNIRISNNNGNNNNNIFGLQKKMEPMRNHSNNFNQQRQQQQSSKSLFGGRNHSPFRDEDDDDVDDDDDDDDEIFGKRMRMKDEENHNSSKHNTALLMNSSNDDFEDEDEDEEEVIPFVITENPSFHENVFSPDKRMNISMNSSDHSADMSISSMTTHNGSRSTSSIFDQSLDDEDEDSRVLLDDDEDDEDDDSFLNSSLNRISNGSSTSEEGGESQRRSRKSKPDDSFLQKRPRVARHYFSRLHEDFHQIETIGQGSFGKVVRGKNRYDGTTYAIKISSRVIKGERHGKAMLREVHALSTLVDNPYIVKYFSSWIEDGRLYVQTEYCEGGTLQDFFRRGQNFNENTLIEVIRQVGRGLHLMHSQNLVHMDIKPENVFVKNGGKLFKIGDLGFVASSLEFNRDFLEGDCRYLSREILDPLGEPNLKKVDIFALGASIFELAFGKPLPQNGKYWNDLRDGKIPFLTGFSPNFQNLVHVMMHPIPEKRPTMGDILQHPLIRSRETKINEVMERNMLLEKVLIQNSKVEEALRREIEMLKKENEKLNLRGMSGGDGGLFSSGGDMYSSSV